MKLTRGNRVDEIRPYHQRRPATEMLARLQPDTPMPHTRRSVFSRPLSEREGMTGLPGVKESLGE